MPPPSARVAARRVSIATWVGLVALVLTMVAACGGGSSKSTCQTDSDATASTSGPEANLTVKVGSYQGTGSPQCIKEIGFDPVVVIIKGDTGAFAVWRSASMEGDSTADFGNGQPNIEEAITSLDSGAFSLGTDLSVNTAGVTYYYVAFAASPDIKVGSYEGDGTDRRAITGIGFAPALVFIKRDGLASAVWRSTALPADSSVTFGFNASGETTGRIQAFEADGFVVGADPFVNNQFEQAVYHYVAFREAPGQMATGSYEGDGSDNRDIAGLGFQPDYVWVKSGKDETWPVHRTSAVGGDFTLQFGAAPNLPDQLQTLLPDGFQIGSDPTVNSVGATYYYVAFKAGSGPELPIP